MLNNVSRMLLLCGITLTSVFTNQAKAIEFKFDAIYSTMSSGPAALVNAFGVADKSPVTGTIFFDPTSGAIDLFTIQIDGADSFIAHAGNITVLDVPFNSPDSDVWQATSTGLMIGPRPGGFIPVFVNIKVTLPPGYYNSVEIGGPPIDLSVPPDLAVVGNRQAPRFTLKFGGIGPNGQLEGLIDSITVPEPTPALLMLAAMLAFVIGAQRRR